MPSLDDRLRSRFNRIVNGNAGDDLFEQLARRRGRRRVARRAGVAGLAVLVILVSVGGFLALSRAFQRRSDRPAEPPGNEGAIVYSSTYGSGGAGDGHLWISDAAGGNASRLTHGPGVDVNATLSADGRTVAFIRLDQTGRFGKWSLWTTTLSGSELQLTHPLNQATDGAAYPRSLSFSPDGSRIALDTGPSALTESGRSPWTDRIRASSGAPIRSPSGGRRRHPTDGRSCTPVAGPAKRARASGTSTSLPSTRPLVTSVHLWPSPKPSTNSIPLGLRTEQ